MGAVCKLAGSLLVLMSSIALGVLYAMRIRERYHFLEELKSALVLLKGEITYARPQMSELLFYLAEHTQNGLHTFFYGLGKKIEQEQQENFSALWREQCTKCFGEKEIGRDNRDFLIAIGDSLRVHDASTMTQVVELYLLRLGQRMEKEAAGMEEKLRLVRLLSLFTGMMVVLVLI